MKYLSTYGSPIQLGASGEKSPVSIIVVFFCDDEKLCNRPSKIVPPQKIKKIHYGFGELQKSSGEANKERMVSNKHSICFHQLFR
jgi:hypothetical protein